MALKDRPPNTGAQPLPRFVQCVIDRKGRAHYYFRRPGFPRAALHGEPGSIAFMQVYDASMIGAAPRGGMGTVIPGSTDAVALGYLNSKPFREGLKSPASRKHRRAEVEWFTRDYGKEPFATLHRCDVPALVEFKGPGATRNFLSMLRALAKQAISMGVRADDPTAGFERPKLSRHGWHTWTEDEIAIFEGFYPLGTMERLAFALLLYTVQRRGDVVRMGWQHVKGGTIAVQQSKTGKRLSLPLHPALRAALDAMPPSDHLTFLTLKGRPFAPRALSEWLLKRCRRAGLPEGRTAHGLRKAGCRRLAEAGCSANVIAAISGHADLREVARYTRDADQARMAQMGMAAMTAVFGNGVETPAEKTGVKETEENR